MEYKLSDFMELKHKKLSKENGVNIIYAPTGSGKTHFIFNNLFNETNKFIDDKSIGLLRFNPNKILYVAPTTMLNDEVLTDISYTTLFGKGSINNTKGINNFEDMLKENNGNIKVITYAKLGFLLGQDGFLKAITDNFSLIIFDEFHDLYRYSNRYDNDDSEYGYFSILDNLDEITSKVLTIGLTATPHAIRQYIKDKGTVKHKTTFIITESEQSELMSLKEKEIIECRKIDHILRLMIDKRKLKHNKMLIYTQKVETEKEYAKILNDKGIKTRILFSPNNKKDTFTTDDKELREYILKEKRLPQDLQCLIINASYECGWNLKDENINIVLVDSTDETTQKQARSRVRHDIKTLYIKSNNCNFLIDDYNIKFSVLTKYLNKDLTKGLKEELMNVYGRKIIRSTENRIYFDLSWTQFIEQLEFSGYEVINNKVVKAGTKSKGDKNLKKFVSKDLDSKKQEELINLLDLRDDRNRLIKSVSKLNEHLKTEYNLEIETVRKTVKGVKKTFWTISSL